VSGRTSSNLSICDRRWQGKPFEPGACIPSPPLSAWRTTPGTAKFGLPKMRRFLIQLGWEFRKLAARPRSYFGFWAIVATQLLISGLLRFPAVRAAIARHLWKMQWGFDDAFSGLTTAAHMLAMGYSISPLACTVMPSR
jgi:hypothetical protein